MASRIDDLRRRLERDPGSRLFAQLAEELRKAGELDQAIEVCRGGLERHASYGSAHMTLGRALFDKGELSEARTELETLLKGAPDNILASRMLGECLEGLGALSEAIVQYKTTLLLAPGEPHMVERLANLEAGGEPSKPRVAAEKPEDPPAETAAPGQHAASQQAAEVAEEPPAPSDVPSKMAAAGRAVTRPGMTGKVQAQNVLAAALAAQKAKQQTQGPPGEAAPEPAEPPAEEPERPAPERFPGMPNAESSLIGIDVRGLSAPEAEGDVSPTPPAAAQAPDFGDSPPTAEPPEAASPPGAAAPPAEKAEEIVSATLAELHVEQGNLDEAKAMYRKLLERQPENQQARGRLAELEAGQAATPAEPGPADRDHIVRRQIAALGRMLERVRQG